MLRDVYSHINFIVTHYCWIFAFLMILLLTHTHQLHNNSPEILYVLLFIFLYKQTTKEQQVNISLFAWLLICSMLPQAFTDILQPCFPDGIPRFHAQLPDVDISFQLPMFRSSEPEISFGVVIYDVPTVPSLWWSNSFNLKCHMW